MSSSLDRYFICGHCYGKFRLADRLQHVSPFDPAHLLSACPHCRRVIADEFEMSHPHLACSHPDCRQAPIGSDEDGWWCQQHRKP